MAAVNPRIPLALQQIFLQSQRGEDVAKIAAPKNGMGFRIFRRFGAGRRKPKQRPVKAPTTSSLHSERSATSKETAADASRKAMSSNKKLAVQQVRITQRGEWRMFVVYSIQDTIRYKIQ
jgi:hypothetical protein